MMGEITKLKACAFILAAVLASAPVSLAAQIEIPGGKAFPKDEIIAAYGGRTVKSFLLQREGLPLMEILVDAESFRILRAAGQFTVAGKPATLSAEFGDFRKADSLTLPFKTTYYSSGQKIAESIIESYALNPEGAGDVFNQPR